MNGWQEAMACFLEVCTLPPRIRTHNIQRQAAGELIAPVVSDSIVDPFGEYYCGYNSIRCPTIDGRCRELEFFKKP